MGAKKKGGEHKKNARPSTRQKHEDAQAAKKNQEDTIAWKAYKTHGGKLAKGAWINAGRPKR